MRTSLFAFLVVALVSLSACDSSDAPYEIAELTGTYEGVYIYTGDDEPETEPVSLELAATPADQAVTLTIRSQDDSEATFEGTYDDAGIRFERPADVSGPYEFSIDRDGVVSGGGTSSINGAPLEFDYSGRLSPERFDLTITLRTESEAGMVTATAAYQTNR